MDTTELERAATSMGIAWACGYSDRSGSEARDTEPAISVRSVMLKLVAPGFPWGGERPELVRLLNRAFRRGASRGGSMWRDA
jgi:hypothetical protein